jgi:hypothetical protein
MEKGNNIPVVIGESEPKTIIVKTNKILRD